MDKPVTAQELMIWIDSYLSQKLEYRDIRSANKILVACRAYLEEMENGT